MTWAKLHDGFPNNPKVVGLSDSAFRLYVSGLCYCSANLTDGAIPRAALLRPLCARRRDVVELVASGLWHESQTGAVVVHDYLTYNPSRAQVEAQRKAAAERLERHRVKRNADATPLQTPTKRVASRAEKTLAPSRPVPSPNIDPIGSGSAPPARPRQTRRWRRVPDIWAPAQDHIALACALRVDLDREAAAFRDHEFAQPKSDADAAFRNWLRRAAQTSRDNGARPPADRPLTELEQRQFERISRMGASK